MRVALSGVPQARAQTAREWSPNSSPVQCAVAQPADRGTRAPACAYPPHRASAACGRARGPHLVSVFVRGVEGCARGRERSHGVGRVSADRSGGPDRDRRHDGRGRHEPPHARREQRDPTETGAPVPAGTAGTVGYARATKCVAGRCDLSLCAVHGAAAAQRHVARNVMHAQMSHVKINAGGQVA